MDVFTISTSKGRLTESEALEIELDVIPALQMPQKIATFKHNDLYLRKPLIEDLISCHLGIPTSDFVLDEPQDWIHGSFNLCLVLDIDSSHSARLPRTAVIRDPYRLENLNILTPISSMRSFDAKLLRTSGYKRTVHLFPHLVYLALAFQEGDRSKLSNMSQSFID
ncbi:hypothetical protein E4T38_00848 [Aureobasidium subglaciale]|nr:hypothetical protein E4T38_00848 [Aureobasidium subglaciale]KAI5230790.1 hypothetical protein E4T40_00849 [Aureobasidium subglaciale]KAI5233814.1 hypothetical protein E4T41_00847 [Aureobasidium subglaciale]KAI5267164.1 hypothetical protein E4T46_00847 [Aureobasidium subglaciale]